MTKDHLLYTRYFCGIRLFSLKMIENIRKKKKIYNNFKMISRKPQNKNNKKKVWFLQKKKEKKSYFQKPSRTRILLIIRKQENIIKKYLNEGFILKTLQRETISIEIFIRKFIHLFLYFLLVVIRSSCNKICLSLMLIK